MRTSPRWLPKDAGKPRTEDAVSLCRRGGGVGKSVTLVSNNRKMMRQR